MSIVDLLQCSGLQALGNNNTTAVMEGEVSSPVPIWRKISLEMGSVRPSLLAEGDELATGAALLLSCPVLVQAILACWQGGN